MALKVFDLQCEQGHIFEGWFRSQENYEAQIEQGMLQCPVCGSAKLNKKLAAPRLNLRHHGVTQSDSARVSTSVSSLNTDNSRPVASPDVKALQKMQAELFNQFKAIVRSSEDVGVRFAEEARRMHQGESPERSIRGSATAEEYVELAEEGIAVMPIPEFMDDDRLQ